MPLTTLRTPARTTTDLILYAESRGLAVEWVLDLPERGRYVPARRTILLREGMTERRTHSTLAHEIAHAHWHDSCSTEHTESRAWQCAAIILIHPHDYALAEQINPSPGAIARELTVTTEVVHGFQRLLAAGPTVLARKYAELREHAPVTVRSRAAEARRRLHTIQTSTTS